MPFVLVKVYICYDSIIQMNNQRHTERIQHIEVYGASLSVLHAHVVLYVRVACGILWLVGI